jgi:hypothetical protein
MRVAVARGVLTAQGVLPSPPPSSSSSMIFRLEALRLLGTAFGGAVLERTFFSAPVRALLAPLLARR